VNDALTTAAAPWGAVPSGERWSSGRWALDLRGDELADIRCDGEVMLRAVRLVARDVDWHTAWPREITARPGPADLAVDLVIDDLGIDLNATLTVTARGDRLEIAVDAVVRSDSRTNRTGLVLLHPPRLAGEELQVAHPEGGGDSLLFPVSISPHQPARDVSALTWSDGPRLFRADFAGDVFEMEDQRNWSDASYKTYNRSLDEPFPYPLMAEEHIRQRITLTALGPLAPPSVSPTGAGPAASTTLTMTSAGSVPTVAIGASTAPDPGPTAADPVGAHRHVELELTDPAWPAALGRARHGARDLSVLLVSPSPPDPGVLEQVMRRMRGIDLRWVAVVDAVSHVSEPELVEALRDTAPPHVPVVGGSRSHFTEVNREWDRLPWSRLDGLVFPITPLFHTLETEQLVESIAMQRVIAQDVTARAPECPVHIGPVTLRPRFDNVATTPAPVPTRSDLTKGYGAERTGQDDPRQAAPQLAAWTIASAAALAVPGVASVTWFEEWGPRGIRTADGADLPVRAALEALVSLEGGTLLSAASPDGWLWAIGARWEGGRRPDGVRQEILVANVSGTQRSIELRVDDQAAAPVTLEAFTWARISDLEEGPWTS